MAHVFIKVRLFLLSLCLSLSLNMWCAQVCSLQSAMKVQWSIYTHLGQKKPSSTGSLPGRQVRESLL